MRRWTGCTCGPAHRAAAAAYELAHDVLLLHPHLPDCPRASARVRRSWERTLLRRAADFDLLDGPDLETAIDTYLSVGGAALPLLPHWGPDDPRRRLCR